MSRRDLRFDSAVAGNLHAEDGNLTLLEVEKKHIERVLDEERGPIEQAALRPGIPRSSLYQKLKRHGINVPRV